MGSEVLVGYKGGRIKQAQTIGPLSEAVVALLPQRLPSTTAAMGDLNNSFDFLFKVWILWYMHHPQREF
jgi:hypothetical protein